MTQKSIKNPGEPPGIELSIAKSIRPHGDSDFLCDEWLKNEWGILAKEIPIEEMTRIAKGQYHCGNKMTTASNSLLHTTVIISFTGLIIIITLKLSSQKQGLQCQKREEWIQQCLIQLCCQSLKCHLTRIDFAI
ncbi:hypothetical protein ACB094_09G020100 [Castanea mollissima]